MEGFNPIVGLLAFLFVIGLLLLTLWFLKSKTALGGAGGKSNLRVLDTLRIDPKNRICVLAYEDKQLLLGISPNTITLLDSQGIDPAQIAGEPVADALNKSGFKQHLGALLNQHKD